MSGSAVGSKQESYLNAATLPFPFCPGCGHHTVLEKLNEALVTLQPDPEKLVLVSDIGCSGLADQFFSTNALHGLHGRSVTYATGVKLANPELTVVVLMGDGGCGIGGHHLLNAARRNMGITVVVMNNFNYGMTGGQHSVSTPPGGITGSSPLGALERPMDICGTVAANGATFVARTTTFDPDLPSLLARAVSHPNVARIFDFGEWQGNEFITMEYIDGQDLTRRLRDCLPLTMDEGRRILTQLCQGLAAAVIDTINNH